MARGKYSGGKRASDPAWRVVIAIGPSRHVAAFVMALASSAMACVLMSGLDGRLALAACAALAIAAVISLRRDALREGRGSVRRLVVDVDGRIEATGSEGATLTGRVSAGSLVAPWLTVVRWRPEGARLARTVLVPPDAVDPDAFRRLRVLLRWGG
jgi:toxin CptA